MAMLVGWLVSCHANGKVKGMVPIHLDCAIMLYSCAGTRSNHPPWSVESSACDDYGRDDDARSKVSLQRV